MFRSRWKSLHQSFPVLCCYSWFDSSPELQYSNRGDDEGVAEEKSLKGLLALAAQSPRLDHRYFCPCGIKGK